MKRSTRKLLSSVLFFAFALSTIVCPVMGASESNSVTVGTVANSVNQAVYGGTSFPTIQANNIANNTMCFSGDNEYELYVNGVVIGTDNRWANAETYQGLPFVYGKNVLAVKDVNYNVVAGVIFEINIDGKKLVSDRNSKVAASEYKNWKVKDFDDSAWKNAIEYGKTGTEPWGFIDGLPVDSAANWIWGNNLYSSSGFVRYTFYIEAPTSTPTPTFTPTSTSTPTPTNTPAFIYGDLNGDKKVDSADYTYMRKYLLHMIDSFPVADWQKAADIFLDGTINTGDLDVLNRYIRGQIKTLPYKK